VWFFGGRGRGGGGGGGACALENWVLIYALRRAKKEFSKWKVCVFCLFSFGGEVCLLAHQ